ncbi:MAG: DUF4013 domain-containing protein [Haloferacaceae archaeon]
MLRDALAVLPRSDDGIGTAIVGGVLLFLTPAFLALWIAATVATPLALLAAPVALAPALVLRGYHVRVVQSGLRAESSVPSFVGWGGLYRTGFASLLLSAALLLPAGALVALGGAAGAVIQLGRVDLGGMGEAVYAASIALLAVLLVGYLLVFLYVRPAALACYAATGRLRAGLSPRRVLRIAVSGGFATGWLVAMFVTLAGLTLLVPLVAILVGFPLAFVVRVVAHNLYGRGAAAELSPPEPESKPSPGPERPPEADSADVVVSPEGSGDREADLGHGQFRDAVERFEPDPDVQVGRRVPLTASDVLSRAAEREAASQEPGGRSTDEGSTDEGPTDEGSTEGEGGAEGDPEAAFEWADGDGDES